MEGDFKIYFMKYKGVHMNIAICDIDKEFASIIKLKIEEKLGSVDVDIYTDSKLLMQSDKVYDCVFLYMDMPDINGIDMARCIREKYTFTKMIFILSKLDAVLKGDYHSEEEIISASLVLGSEKGFTRDGVAVMPDTEKVQELSGSDMAHWR